MDLEQWIEQAKVEVDSKHQILHSHYMKKIATQKVINKKLAHLHASKISILVSDLVRVVGDISEQCNREERSMHIQHFIHSMQFSGYAQDDKVLVYKKAKKLFDIIVEQDSVRCIGENFGRGGKEKRKTSTCSVIGIKEEIMI